MSSWAQGGLILVISARAEATTACCAARLGRAQPRRQLGDKRIDIAGNVAAGTLEKATSVFIGEWAIAELKHGWNCHAARSDTMAQAQSLNGPVAIRDRRHWEVPVRQSIL